MPLPELFKRVPEVNSAISLTAVTEANERLCRPEMAGSNPQVQALGVIRDMLMVARGRINPDELPDKPEHEMPFNSWDKHFIEDSDRPLQRKMLIEVGKRSLLNMYLVTISHNKVMRDGVSVNDSFDFQTNLPNGYYFLSEAVTDKLEANNSSKVRKLFRYLKGACRFDWKLTKTVVRPGEDYPTITNYFIDTTNDFLNPVVTQKYRLPIAEDSPQSLPVDFRLYSDSNKGQVKIYTNVDATESDDDVEDVNADKAILLDYDLSDNSWVPGVLWQASTNEGNQFTSKVFERIEGMVVPVETDTGTFNICIPSKLSKDDILSRLRRGDPAMNVYFIKS